MSKLWDKGKSTDQWIEKFTIGQDRELDLWLAKWDVLGSLAHIRMLESIDLLTQAELKTLSEGLRNIHEEILEGKFQIEEGVEDVHSQVEFLLSNRLGEVGKKIHAGRSRNDQVLLDLKLFTRQQIQSLCEKTQTLFDTLLELSEKYQAVLLPGYTHLQVAMPSSFGLWFGAYAESLSDDLQLLLAAYKITNQNPLGSAAGYGSSFPLNRQMTTDLLGFERMNYNVVYAQMGRGKVEKSVSFAIASLAGTLAKMALDICLYMNQNFAFIRFPDQLTTGSSIMPHKKNPDVFELIRGKCNQLQNLPSRIGAVTMNLPSGYHRDLQVIKESFLPAFNTLEDCLEIANYALQHVQVREGILQEEKYQYLFSVEQVNALVLQGIPFREAYQQVGKSIEEGTYQPDLQINHTHEGSIGNLCSAEIRAKMQEIQAQFNFEKVERALQLLLENA